MKTDRISDATLTTVNGNVIAVDSAVQGLRDRLRTIEAKLDALAQAAQRADAEDTQ